MTAPSLLFINARVHTVDDAMPAAEAVAVADGRISWVGDSETARGLAGPDTEVIDAGGHTVLPGFIDSHNHVRLGSNPLEVDLAGAGTLDEVKARIRAHADAHPDYSLDRGRRVQLLGDARRADADAEDLEGLTGGRPAFIFTYDAHNAWLNREALDVFGITRDTDALAVGSRAQGPAERRAHRHRRRLRGDGHLAPGPGRARGRRARLRAVAPVRADAREPRHGDRGSGSPP